MKDYKISLQEFINNKGYSSHYFFNHSMHFLRHIDHKNIKIDVYRKKIILQHKTNKITVKCHYKNKSRHYISILKSKKEIATLHDSIPPALMTKIIMTMLQSHTK
jgi:hypothetical protein